jgi:hypothetical protein
VSTFSWFEDILYAAAMERSSERSLPVAGVFCALCNNPFDAVFNLTATECFVRHSVDTQDFLRSIRIEP